MKKKMPSLDQWLREAKADPGAAGCGMYLMHNGTVRQTARAKVRLGEQDTKPVRGMRFSYDKERVEEAIAQTRAMEGIGYVRVWLNEGELGLGDDIMLVLVGGDIRPHVVDALQYLVGRIKNECVREHNVLCHRIHLPAQYCRQYCKMTTDRLSNRCCIFLQP